MKQYNEMGAEIARLEAEVERLKETLCEIEEWTSGTGVLDNAKEAVVNIRRIVSAALEDKP